MNKNRSFFKVLAWITAVVVLCSLPIYADGYSDTEGHWAHTEITKWSDLGIIRGHNGSFRPNDSVTRAELAAIVDQIMKYTVKSELKFSDVGDAWYADAVLKCSAAGILFGDGGRMRPSDSVTREEAAVILGRVLGLEPIKGATAFSDDADLSDWSRGYVKALSESGKISGVGKNRFDPKSPITRASVVKLLDNGVLLYAKEGKYAQDTAKNVIIASGGVTLEHMTVEGNLIIAPGVGEGEVHLNNVRIKGKVLAQGGGEHSVYFNNVDVEGALVINKRGGNIRIVATGSSKISVVTMETGAILVTKELVTGRIDKVVVTPEVAKDQNIVLIGNFAQVENNASDIKIQAEGKIEKIVLNEKSDISGKVEIKEVKTAKNAESVINGKEIKAEQEIVLKTENTESTNTSASTSTSSSSSSSSDSASSSDSSSDTGNSSEDTGSGAEEYVTVTFYSAGGTDVSSARVPKGSVISKPGNPTKLADGISLNFVGWYRDSEHQTPWDFDQDTANEDLTLYAKWENPNMDNRFAEGYPKLQRDGEKFLLKLKLAEGVGEAEIFTVMHPWGGGNFLSVFSSTTSQNIVDGYLVDQRGQVDQYSVWGDRRRSLDYVKLSDTEEHTISYNWSDISELHIALVLKSEGKISEQPIYLELYGQAAEEVYSGSAVVADIAVLNDAKNGIYIYFNFMGSPDSNSIPEASCFSLRKKNDDPVPLNITELKMDHPGERHRLILTLGESLSFEDGDDLYVIYTSPQSGGVQDAQGNQAGSFEKFLSYRSAVEAKAFVGESSEMIYVRIPRHLFEPWNDNLYDIKLSYGADSENAAALEYQPVDRRFRAYGTEYLFRFSKENAASDGMYFVKIQAKDGETMHTYADDEVDPIEITAETDEANHLAVEKATKDGMKFDVVVNGYDTKYGDFYYQILGRQLGIRKEGNFYALRGFADAYRRGNDEKIKIHLHPSIFKHIPEEVFDGATLEYTMDGSLKETPNEMYIFSSVTKTPFPNFNTPIE